MGRLGKAMYGAKAMCGVAAEGRQGKAVAVSKQACTQQPGWASCIPDHGPQGGGCFELGHGGCSFKPLYARERARKTQKAIVMRKMMIVMMVMVVMLVMVIMMVMMIAIVSSEGLSAHHDPCKPFYILCMMKFVQ